MILKQVYQFIQKNLFAIFLLGLTIITYGLLVFSLGFYLDDWYIVLYQKYFGGTGFLQFFQEDRPFFGYVYMIFLPIFQDSRIAWQLFAIFTRWLATFAFWKTFTVLFPNYEKIWKWSAILFLVYPGFQFHWFSIMYSQVYLLLTVYFLSYYFMYRAFMKQGVIHLYLSWTALALLCEVIGIIPMEYFYGLEFFRPFVFGFLIYLQNPTPRKPFAKAILNSLPYLAVFTGFTLFRVFHSSDYSYQVNILTQISLQPIQTILEMTKEVIKTLFNAGFVSWLNAAKLLIRDTFSKGYYVMLGLMILSALLTNIYLANKKNTSNSPEKSNRGWIFMVCGLILTVFALVPFIAASFTVSLDFPNNRFLLSLALGIGIFIAGALEEFLRTEMQKIAILALLTGLAVGSQFNASHGFYLQWMAQRDFFWQLTWRAPGLKPGTALLTEDLPFAKYSSGPSLSAPLNMIYSPANKSHTLNYLFLLISSPQGEAIPDYAPGKEILYSFRRLNFSGSTNSMIVFYQPTNGCLRFLSSEDSADEFGSSQRKWFWEQAIPLSNLDQVITNPSVTAVPPQKYFGNENTNQWCYYYEKADLARQQDNWEQVIAYFNKAASLGFYPLNNQERLPLLEAFLQTMQIDQASSLAVNFSSTDTTEVTGACKLIANAEPLYRSPLASFEKYALLKVQFNCGE